MGTKLDEFKEWWAFSSLNPSNSPGWYVFALAVATFGTFFTGLGVHDKAVNEALEKIKITENGLSETINQKTGLVEFNPISFNLEYNENEDTYNVNIFGSYNNTIEDNNVVKNLTNVKFDISKEDAKAIAEAVKKREDFGKYAEEIKSNLDNISNITFEDNGKERIIFHKKAIMKAYDLTEDVYTALQQAIINAYNYKVEHISESSNMLNSISKTYRYVKPELMSDTGGMGIRVNTEFIDCGIVLSGISNVYQDDENNLSFFYVDTLQTTNGVNYEHHKAIVRVEGSNITAEEAYQKFINGDILSFDEIVQTQTQQDTTLLIN